MRTFVFISEIPPFLLEPLAIASHGSSSGKPQRDPTYERLRRLLVDHSSGVMVVMHLGSRGYGLALYASKEEALAACQTTIQPDSQNGATYPPLRLRIVERETAPPPEAVYSPTILIEGESVLKSELADTRGLEGTYRGQCVPRWCPKTVEKVDCPFGTNCNRIHRLAYQRTVRKLPRTDEEEWAGALHHLSPEEREVVNRITHSHREAQEHVVPTELRLQPSVYVPVTREEARTLACGRGKPEYESLLQGLTKRVESACAEANLKPDSLFMQLTIPGGAPWDWGLGDSTPGGGLSRLRERCTLPANGAPTPLERDIFAQRLFHAVNHINRFPAAETGLRAFGWSQRVGRALEAYLERDGGKEELFICVQPWLYLPTVGCEATLFLERGGRRLRGLVQRYGELRLMTSASYLHKATQEKEAVNRALDHFAVLGSHADTPAEEGLEQDMQLFARPLRTAALSLRRHLAGRRTAGASSSPSVALPAGASWCAHLAVVLPVPVDGVVHLDPSTPPTVVVKSVSPYKEGVENCALYSQVNMRQMQSDDSSSASAEVEMVWNTHKHLYASLFPREVMTKFASSTA